MPKQIQFDFELSETKEFEENNSLYNWCLKNSRQDILSEWDYDKNKDVNPMNITYASNKKFWWKCQNNPKHNWLSAINNRTHQKSSCPYCSNKKVLIGYNDIATTNPECLIEWDYDKNSIKPEEITVGSNKKVWWLCKDYKHSWASAPVTRVKGGFGCPVCSGLRIEKGFNDLETLFPDVAKEWDYEKNEKTPDSVAARTRAKAWWKCKKGHSWQASIVSRTSLHTGCPICAKPTQSSISEKIISVYLGKYFNDLKNNYKPDWLEKHELDIYIPSIKVAIEYDGGHFHKDVKRDIWKDKKCIENKVDLIRFRDTYCPKYDSKVKIINAEKTSGSYLELEKPLIELFEYLNDRYNLNLVFDVNIERDIQDLLSEIDLRDIENSVYNSDVIDEWDWDKNKIDPRYLTQGNSRIKVWWECKKCGYEWKSVPSTRIGLGCGCPACGHQIATDDNNLEVLYPDVAKEWNYEKNDNLPSSYLPNSNLNVWWKCKKCGYEWETSPSHRTARGHGCPVCSNNKIVPGVNDLFSKAPEIIKDWDYDKNVIKPSEISSGSNKKAWWKCHKCGYEWQSIIASRTKRNTPCPACNNRELFIGYNDIATKYPNIIKYWDYEKNDKGPENYLSGSNELVWWKCDKGHSHQQTIYLKVVKKIGCPVCKNSVVIPGVNDFAFLEPELLKEWDFDKNDIKPTEISSRNDRKAWWKCEKGHSWFASIGQRVRLKSGCPECYRLSRYNKTK